MDSALLPDWNASSELASRTQDSEEDDSMVRSGGFVGDNETDDLERKSLSGFKGGKKKVVVGNHFKIMDCSNFDFGCSPTTLRSLTLSQ
jgi:hypothetical protein